MTEPDIMYRYNCPVASPKNCLDTPMSLNIEVVNIIEHPFKEEPSNILELNSIESEHKRNFQQLFSKYIDNKLLLVV